MELIDDPMFTTSIGKEFSLDQIDLAMTHKGKSGAKAVLVRSYRKN